MSISSEDIKVCDCCGRPTVEGGIRKIQEVEDAHDEEFWICDFCESRIQAGESFNVGLFISDVSMIFDIWAIKDLSYPFKTWDELRRNWLLVGVNHD
jgi:hypothetical protein